MDLAALALTWSVTQPEVVEPIIGTIRETHLTSALEAVEFRLPEHMHRHLDRLSPGPPRPALRFEWDLQEKETAEVRTPA